MAFCEVGHHAAPNDETFRIDGDVACCSYCADDKVKCNGCPRIEKVKDLTADGLCPDCAPAVMQ